jgi:hypothetical protein
MILGLAMAGLVVPLFTCVFCQGVVLRIAVVRWFPEKRTLPQEQQPPYQEYWFTGAFGEFDFRPGRC